MLAEEEDDLDRDISMEVVVPRRRSRGSRFVESQQRDSGARRGLLRLLLLLLVLVPSTLEPPRRYVNSKEHTLQESCDKASLWC